MKLRTHGVLLLVLAIWVPGSLMAQNQPPPQDRPQDQLRTLSRDELDVVKVLTVQERAWNRGDIDAFLSGYKDSPDILFVGRQVSRGFQELQLDYKKNYANKEAMGILSFSELEPHILDERFAVALGHYHLDRSKKAGGPADGVFSLVFEKTDKGWKIIVDHTT